MDLCNLITYYTDSSLFFQFYSENPLFYQYLDLCSVSFNILEEKFSSSQLEG